MANIVQLLLYFIIAVGVNNWFDLTWEVFAFAVLGTLLALNAIGYVFDKKGFFVEHAERQFKIALPPLWFKQMRTWSALFAQATRMDDDELEETIVRLSKELGL